METVFDTFRETPFTYLEISRGNVYGNIVVSETPLMGIVKIRANMEQSQNIEDRTSSSTIHAHPEDFDTPVENLVGNGVSVDDIDYKIISATEGKNFETGIVEHLTFTLQRAEFTRGS